jgi:hypothetical protein
MDAPGLIPSLIGAPLRPDGGAVAGTIEDLLVDAATHRPVWLLVRLHRAERPYTFVPAGRMAVRARAIAVPFDEAALRSAPVRLAAPEGCSGEDLAVLSRHYGVRVASCQARPLRPAAPRISRAAA